MKPVLMSAGILMLGACSPSTSMDSGSSLLRDTGATATSQPTASTAGGAGAAPSGTAATTNTMAAATATSPAVTATTPAMSTSMMAAAAGEPATGTSSTSAAAGAAAATSGAAGTDASATAMMGAAGGPGMETTSTPSGPAEGSLTVSFTTESYGGFYAPRNYGAVWIEDSGGEFIKTAERWAGRHSRDLVEWTRASGGWPSPLGGGGNAADMMDVASTATLMSHQMHTAMWNGQDADKSVVPDGDYVAVIEVTEDRMASPGPVMRIPFTKGAEAHMVEPSDEAAITGVKLTWEPN